jgi:nucleotide-binding universal stress UspA family protein
MTNPYVLVMLTSTIGAQECLRVATRVGEALQQPIRILHVQVGPGAIILPSQETLSEYEVEHMGEREHAETEALRKLTIDWAQAHGSTTRLEVAYGDDWRELRHHRNTASLVVLPSPYTQPLGHRDALRAALIRTRHPVIMIPPGWKGDFARRLLVGWEDVPPLRRAIGAFAPFLRQAEQVEAVLVGQPDTAVGLARTVLTPVVPNTVFRSVIADGRKTATALLDEARACRADGIVMGAFRRGEILNWLVPGTSARLIQESSVPLLMSP